jgi:hypothetical protein
MTEARELSAEELERALRAVISNFPVLRIRSTPSSGKGG